MKVIPEITYQYWLTAFIKNNDIRDTNGECYHLTSHQFRRTLATDMLSKGTDLKAIQEVLGHSSPSTTKQSYADVKDKERAEVFKNIGIIGNINKVDETVIENKNDLIWFKENKDKGARMEDGYCTKPCSDGKICDRLLKRQKCYTCSRYITTPEYLQAHKNHLEELEKQLEGNIYGDHYAEHFLPTIEILKEIVKRLEEIQDGNN
ncbi:MAG: tyrosine-type recombinase/integrase [Sarcina sp.]